MTMYKEILRLSNEGRLSGRDIAASCRCSYTTVKRILSRAGELALTYDSLKGLSDPAIAKLLYPKAKMKNLQKEPDFEHVHRELAKSGVTLALLWNEYSDACIAGGECHYMYSQFCNLYRHYAAANKLSCHIGHKPGEVMEVDWAGTKMTCFDGLEGRPRKVSLFVACLPFSGYCYAEAFNNEKQDSWLTAHIHAFNWFGGVPKILRPDNLKTGVLRSDHYEPEINISYRDLAEYYGCFVSPARVLKPRDKATVEGTVGMLTTHIIATLRNMKFHSLKELNQEVIRCLKLFNSRPFQKKDGSRESVYLEEEQTVLSQLPAYEYQVAHYKDLTVPPNYHISVNGHYYSVPCSYVGKKVQVKTTAQLVECFSDGERIAVHTVSSEKGGYSTEQDHMPEAHKQLFEWDEDKFLSWGACQGASTLLLIQKILKKRGSKAPGYKFCAGLRSLAEKYGQYRLEEACSKLVRYNATPSFKTLKLALASVTGKQASAVCGGDISGSLSTNDMNGRNTTKVIGFRRGAEYYGGNKND